jgi:hypothetical protein
MRYKCLGIKPEDSLIPKIEMLSNLYLKIGFFKVDKVYSESEIQMISDKLEIDAFNSFTWISNDLQYDLVVGGILVITIKEVISGCVEAQKFAHELGFIYGTEFEELIPEAKQYKNCFKVVKERYNLHLGEDFNCTKFNAVIFNLPTLQKKVICIHPFKNN